MLNANLDAFAVLLPIDCAGCGAPDRSLCDACRLAIACEPLSTVTPGGLDVRSALAYEGVPRQLVLALKEHNRTDVAHPLAARLAPLLPPALDLVAVPSSPGALARRGYDPVRLLVRPHRTLRVLQVATSGVAQKTLGIDARAANRAGSLRARWSLSGLRVVLVDDVVTTGATLDEAARAVRAAGGTVDHAVTLAATPRYFEPPAHYVRDP